MGAPQLISVIMTTLGTAIMAAALFPANRILRELPQGAMRNYWRILRVLILFFIAGYLANLFLFAAKGDPSTMLASLIFFVSACFVFLVCLLARDTVQDILRIRTLETENITDPLMEIFNRRHLERRLAEEVARAARYRFPLSLLMIDIDHFKRINDRYGHPAGDLVLKEIGALLKGNLRNVDFPARYGGEEAAVLLPHTGEADALLVAERIRKKIESASFTIDGPPAAGGAFRCTVSIGIAVRSPECTTPGELVRLADKALYQAKQSGRNRSVVFRSEEPLSPPEAPAPSR